LRISHSSLTKYLECKYKWFVHYLWKLRPEGYRSPLVFGSAIDEGLNTLLETRDLDLALNMFTEKWAPYKNKVVKYSKSDLDEHLVKDEKFKDDQEKTWTSLARS